MVTQTVTVTLDNPDGDSEVKIKGKNLDDTSGNQVDKNEQQIVTILDGGDLEDDDGDPATFVFEFFGKTTADDDEFYLDLSGFDDDFNIAVKSQDPGDCWFINGFDSYVVVGNIWTFTYTGTDGLTHTMSIDAESTNNTGVACVVVCFAGGTRIRTPGGERVIEDLQQGDLVCCGDGQNRRIRWIGSQIFNAEELARDTRLRPVVLKSGALGENAPKRALRLSPQHRVLLCDWRAEYLFGEHEILTPAISLINDTTIMQDHSFEPVEYFHILLDEHHTVFAEGLECESLLPAELALTAVDNVAREEIFLLFPKLAADLNHFGPACHRVLKKFELDVLHGAIDPDEDQ